MNVWGLDDSLLTMNAQLQFFEKSPDPGVRSNNLAIQGQDTAWLDQVVYTASQATLSAPQLSNGQFHFVLTGQVESSYEFDASTNLVDWVPLATIVCTNGTLPCLDLEASNFTSRFYRTRLLP